MANVGLPGSGSLMAGRRCGYFQVSLSGAGLVLTFAFGLRFLWWCVSSWGELRNPQTPPDEILIALWVNVRWVLLGFLLFAAGWIWAFCTSLTLLSGGAGPSSGSSADSSGPR